MAHPAEAQKFRTRLERVMARAKLSQAAFSRQLGIDRSTLSQLLSPANDRLPRAETLAAIARGCAISVDWLLGLSEREQVGAQMVETLVQIEPQAHGLVDQRFAQWLDEAAGRKLRTVPVSFPDFLKNDTVVGYEYAASGEEALPAFTVLRTKILAMLRDGVEFEVCAEMQALELFAQGAAQWAGLDRSARRGQLLAMARVIDELYPSLRLFLYDVRQNWSAPFTVFGRQRAVVYLGPSYLVLNTSAHIAMLTKRFDDLVRGATVQPHEAAVYVERLAAGV